MKRFACFFLLAVAAVSADEIGREDAVGSVRVRHVRTGEDLTVFVRAESTEATAVQVTAVVEGPQGRRLLTRIEPVTSAQKTARLTFSTRDKVTELRVVELIYLTSQTVQVQP